MKDKHSRDMGFLIWIAPRSSLYVDCEAVEKLERHYMVDVPQKTPDVFREIHEACEGKDLCDVVFKYVTNDFMDALLALFALTERGLIDCIDANEAAFRLTASFYDFEVSENSKHG